MMYITASIHDSNEIPTAIPMSSGSGQHGESSGNTAENRYLGMLEIEDGGH